MDMGMKGDQITEGLHKQDISGFAPGRDLFVDLVQQSGDNPTPPAEPVALVKVRPQQLGKSKDILPVGNRIKDLFFYPITVGQHPLLMAARTEVASLAAEGEQVIMATVIAINPGKPFVQVAAVDKSAEGLLLYPAMNHTRTNHFLIVLSHTLIERTGVVEERCIFPGAHLYTMDVLGAQLPSDGYALLGRFGRQLFFQTAIGWLADKLLVNCLLSGAF
jgi:hypothetical protein